MFPQYTTKDNSSRKNGDYINRKDMITVAGTQRTPVFNPVFIQVGQFFPGSLCVSYNPLKIHKTA